MLAAVLTAVTVANVNARSLHRGFLPFAFDVDVCSQTNDRRNRNDGRRRMQNIVAVGFFDRQFPGKLHTNGARDANRAERFVRKVQEQNSACYQWNHLLKLLPV
jgi:hypothetical protein